MIRIDEIIIKNFKCYEGEFRLKLNNGLNILVGDNEAGKTTILEAMHLALSGWVWWRYAKTEMDQSYFNKNVVNEYVASLSAKTPLPPPEILIEITFGADTEDEEKTIGEYFGNGNNDKKNSYGVQFHLAFREQYKNQYESLLASGDWILSLPIEYYDFHWSSFARDSHVVPKLIPVKAAYIDSSGARLQNGSDIYVNRIIRDFLTEEQKISLSQAHRRMLNAFSSDSAMVWINKTIKDAAAISDKKIKLSADVSTKTAWETELLTYLDEIPFHNIGKGEQCLIKTKLALSHRKAKEANILLLEEPENHLSHSKLNELINKIQEGGSGKQIIISTHSSFVANKLGLWNLILLNSTETGRKTVTFDSLSDDTRKYFEKLSGYDTLRFLLSQCSILVEWPSDELIVQKAYKEKYGKLPIEDRIDVISVWTSFLRFLEIGRELSKPLAVVTDNDGDYANKITKKYADYAGIPTIGIFASPDTALRTLEPQIVEANKEQLDLLRSVLWIGKAEYQTEEAITEYMTSNKTESALRVFDATDRVSFPKYIIDAIEWCHGK